MSRTTTKPYTNPFGPPSPDLQGTSIEQETDLVPVPQSTTIPGAAILSNPFDAVISEGDEADNAPLSPRRSRSVVPTNINPDEPYQYNTNHSRGAILLNDYDDAKTGGNLDYHYTKTDADLPRHILLLRKALYVAQMMLLGGAVIIGAGAYTAEKNGWQFSPNNLIFGHMEKELIYVPYACGITSIITALIGFIGSKTRDKWRNALFVLYLISIVITLALASGSTAQAFADKANTYYYAQRQWNRLTVIEERIFEWENFCCNFDTLEPCCRFGYGVTDCVNQFMCFERVEPHLIENFNIIAITSLLHTINMILITISAFVLYGIIQWKERRKLQKAETNVIQNDLR